MKPNFYSILPANVRYDSELTANAKLLYSEITSLTEKSGKCWASNNYFTELFGVTERTIQRCLNVLQQKNYIKIDYKRNGGKKGTDRYILIPTKMSFDPDKNVAPIPTKMSGQYNNNTIEQYKNEHYKIIGDQRKQELYDEWLQYRKEIKKPLNRPGQLAKAAAVFAKHSYQELKEAVEISISNGYTGLFPKSKNKNDGITSETARKLTAKRRSLTMD